MRCPDCDSPMELRSGRYGVFWGCLKFPKCKGTRRPMHLELRAMQRIGGRVERAVRKLRPVAWPANIK